MNPIGPKLLGGLVLAAVTAAAQPPSSAPNDEILAAYSNVRYPQVRRLAAARPGTFEARLCSALSEVFDRRRQNLASGLAELYRIYQDRQAPSAFRAEAGLAYARAVQTLRLRPGVYPPADKIDYRSVYDAIITTFPDDSAAVFAAMYQVQDDLFTDDAALVARGFERLNRLLTTYRGPAKHLGAVHYLLADQYIIHGGNYARAVEELEAALRVGVVNSRTREQITCRIARIYQAQLGRRDLAAAWYRRFIGEFPNSAYVAVARRYLKEMASNNLGRSADVGTGR